MFKGRSDQRLDDKNRLNLPTRWRDELTGGLTVTVEEEGWLGIYCRPTWEAKRVAYLARLDPEDYEDEERALFSMAEDMTPDAQGRITLLQHQVDQLQSGREVVVIGARDRLEVWNPARFESWQQAQNQKADQRRRVKAHSAALRQAAQAAVLKEPVTGHQTEGTAPQIDN